MKNKICILLLLIPFLINAQWEKTSAPDLSTEGWATFPSLSFIGNNLVVGYYDGNTGVLGVFISTDNGSSWASINSGLPTKQINCIAGIGQNLFVGPGVMGIYRSTNNGLSWASVNSGIPLITSVNCFAYNKTNIFAGSHGTVYTSTDNGINWSKSSQGLPTSYNVTSLMAIDTIIFAGYSNTQVGGMYKSSNNGKTWSEVTPRFAWVTSLFLVGKTQFAGAKKNDEKFRIYISTDEGNSWVPSSYITSAECFTVSNSYIFVGSDEGKVSRSRDNGVNWTDESSGLYRTQIMSLVANEKYLFAGTIDHGVWRRPMSELSLIENELNTLPTCFSLSQNYPNPLNPSTTINYSIASGGNVTLKVYDMLGREVATLVDEEKAPGNYEVTFNTGHLERSRDIPSGIYFYRMQAGSFIQTKKFVLMK